MEEEQRHEELEAIRRASRNLGYRVIAALADDELEKLVLQTAEMIATSSLTADQIVHAVRRLVEEQTEETSDRLTETIKAMRDFIDTRKMKVIKARLAEGESDEDSDDEEASVD